MNIFYFFNIKLKVMLKKVRKLQQLLLKKFICKLGLRCCLKY